MDQQQLVAAWSQSAVRLLVVSMVAFSCLWLVLGRWWQSVLFIPGQLQLELHNIRLNQFVVLAAAALMVLALVWRTPWLMDIFPVVMLPLSIAGLSIVHSFVKAKKLKLGWLVGFYVVLLLVLGIIATLLAILAIADSGFNFRQKWQITRG